jgi:hypothetical protein
VGDEIDFAEAGARIVPLGEGADGDLVLEHAAGARDRGPAPRILGARGPQQAGERRAAGLTQPLLNLGGEGQFAAPGEALQEVGDEGLQPMGADPAAGLPQDPSRGGDLRAVLARAAARTPGIARDRGARRSSRMAALRWMPVTATISSNSRCFSARLAV